MKIRSIFVILAIAILIVMTGCGYEKQEKVTDAKKFKEEYEKINNKELDNGKKVRSLTIPEDNPFVYASCNDILNMMDNNETFVVYFGFSNCPWCRSMLPTLIDVAKEKGLDKVYYVDVSEIRDKYTVNENGEVVLEQEGSEGYMTLLKRLDEVLEDYTVMSSGKEYATGEKRIYAPNVVAIVNGKPKELQSGVSKKLENPYGELNDEMINDSKKQLECVLKCAVKNEVACSATNAC